MFDDIEQESGRSWAVILEREDELLEQVGNAIWAARLAASPHRAEVDDIERAIADVLVRALEDGVGNPKAVALALESLATPFVVRQRSA